MSPRLNKKYIDILQSLKEKIKQARLRATIAVNAELLRVYWEIGNTILLQQKQEGWGTKVIGRLASDLKAAFPDMKGLSERNLVYMQTFASAWPNFPFTQAPPAQLLKEKKKKMVLRNKSPESITQGWLAQLSWYHQ